MVITEFEKNSDMDLGDSLLLELNLQFFAKEGPGGEKTEEPTDKKKTDTRKEGQVAKSQELGNAVTLIGFFLILKYGSMYLGTRFLSVFYTVYNKIPETIHQPDGIMTTRTMHVIFRNIMGQILMCVGPFLIIGAILAFVVDLVQVRWAPTSKPLQPKLSKLNPIKGFSRIFSPKKLVDLIKSIAKILIIILVARSMLKDQLGVLLELAYMPLFAAVGTVGTLIINVGLRICIVYLVFAFADFGYERWRFHNDIMMTKQEVKDEMKQSEGDPQVKGQQKARMREASRRRMMQNIPQADVVITNPTHFAVAIKYDPEVADAPIVTAKGQDLVARRIKEIARENGVEIVENKPLARMLYHNVELGGLVPPELFQAVAEVLAFVYNLKQRNVG